MYFECLLFPFIIFMVPIELAPERRDAFSKGVIPSSITRNTKQKHNDTESVRCDQGIRELPIKNEKRRLDCTKHLCY